MKKIWYGIAVSIALLQGCGGGGGSSSAAPSVTYSPIGVWQGTSSTGYTVDLVILPNNNFYTAYGTPSVNNGLTVYGYDVGIGSVNGNNFSANFTEYLYTNQTITGTLSATINSSNSITGGANSSTGQATTFNFSKMSNFNFAQAASINTIVGSWSGTFVGGGTGAVTISSAGALTGSSQGCSYTGHVVPDASGNNYFNLTVTFGSSPCLIAGQTVNGIVITYPTVYGTTQMIAAVTNSPNTLGAMFLAQR
jgi:hypothetical protein